MDHLEALQIQASEKYALGELSPELREQFEEHYFDCAECAEDVKAALTFITAARKFFREQPSQANVVAKEQPGRSRWMSWYRPAILVPAMAAIVLTIGYYSLPSKPQIGEITAPGQVLVSSPSFGLRGGDRVESEKTVLQIPAGNAFQLHFDFVPAQDHNFSSYAGELQDKSSRVLVQFDIPADRVNKEVNLVVPAGLLHPGDYSLVVFGRDASSSVKTAVGKFSFALQNKP
ncbi:MAG: zf-HC2 domain-containing protein [Candidatus Acidiferrum sp.]